MKRSITLLCAAAMLCLLVACGGRGSKSQALKPSDYSDADFDTSGDIVMATEYEVYGGDAPWVSYTITNRTSKELIYGVAYSVEVKQNGAWYQVLFPGDRMYWNAAGIILRPNGTNTDSFSFSSLDYKFSDGQYRLIKEIGDRRYFAEFEVGDSPITAQTPFGYQAPEKLPKEYTAEAAEKNGDVVVTFSETKNIGRLEAFVNKTALGMAAMVRIVQYTIEGDPIITDFIYNENGSGYYLYRHDNSRDRFGASDKGMTQTIFSYLITDGEAIYLSDCAGWALLGMYPGAALTQLAPTAQPGDVAALIGLVEEMTEKRLAWGSTQYKVYSPGGDKSVGLDGDVDDDTLNDTLSYRYSSPGRSEMRYVTDPDKTATRIMEVVWLDNDSFALVCETTGSLKYFKVDGAAEGKSGYGSQFKISDGAFEIVG